QRHPALRVELILGHAQVDLTRREADVALRVLDAHNPDAHPDHIMHRVGPMQFEIYAARSLLKGLKGSQADRVDWRAIDHVGWDTGSRHLALARWLESNFTRPAVLSSNSMSTHLQWIRSGLGVGMLPRFVAAQEPTLIRLPVEDPPRRELWLVYHRDLKSSLRVRAVRQFVEDVVPGALKG
ncbi:MAG: hypothetical protein KGL57_11925, partial [Burkholderiales bacterium]|nr:hypothetical protein [Burkholderiales bacterium]